jgi:hypothetical protein
MARSSKASATTIRGLGSFRCAFRAEYRKATLACLKQINDIGADAWCKKIASEYAL